MPATATEAAGAPSATDPVITVRLNDQARRCAIPTTDPRAAATNTVFATTGPASKNPTTHPLIPAATHVRKRSRFPSTAKGKAAKTVDRPPSGTNLSTTHTTAERSAIAAARQTSTAPSADL